MRAFVNACMCVNVCAYVYFNAWVDGCVSICDCVRVCIHTHTHAYSCFHSFLSIDFNIDTTELSKAHIYKMKACTQGCHHEECPNRIDKYDENHWLYNYYREPNPLFLFGK